MSETWIIMTGRGQGGNIDLKFGIFHKVILNLSQTKFIGTSDTIKQWIIFFLIVKRRN